MHLSSWLLVLGLGKSATCIGLSLYFKSPVLTAWSTPGAALLGTALVGLPMSEAIGAFLFASALITLCGVTGWVETLMKHVPKTLAAAMLGGVLLRFGLGIFGLFYLVDSAGARITRPPALPMSSAVRSQSSTAK